MHQCINFISFWNDALHVSDGLSAHHREFKTTYSNRLLASKRTAVSVWQLPVAVCTVLNSRWWTERPSETCRMLLQNKIKLIWYIGASGWIYYRNVLRCTALWTPKHNTLNVLTSIHYMFRFVRTIFRHLYYEAFKNTSKGKSVALQTRGVQRVPGS